jgi:hypothetical protein
MHLRVVTIDVARQEVMKRDNVPMTVESPIKCCTNFAFAIVGLRPILRTRAMTKGRPPKGVDYIPRGRASYRFPPELLKKIKQGARLKKVSQNAYVEQALRNQLKADGIPIKS